MKQLVADAMTAAFVSVDKASVDGVIEGASEEERATLMKYVCKGMANSEKKVCDVMLAWHAKLVAKDGHGIIMRVMADRKV